MITVIDKSVSEGNETITVSVPKTYVVKYDRECVFWSGNDKRDRLFINDAIQYLNSKLDIGVHVILNTVFTMLGIPCTGEGYLVGWTPGSRIRVQITQENKDEGYLLKIITDGIIIDKF